MFSALESGADAATIGHALAREDMLLLADFGDKARQTCWTKAFVLVVARKLTEFVAQGQDEEQLRYSVDGMFTVLDGLFARLPNGIAVALGDLSLDIYNETCRNLDGLDGDQFLPANIIGHAYTAFLRRRSQLSTVD